MRVAARDVNRTVTDLYGAHGPVFAFGVGPLRFVWLVGPEANRFVLKDAAAHFALGSAYGFLRPVVGERALITSDEPEHLRRRRLVQPAFHGGTLSALEALIEGRLRALFTGWVGRTVNLYTEVRQEVVALIGEILLGPALAKTLSDDLTRMMSFTNLPFHLQLLKLPVPGLPWRRFVAARRRADRTIYEAIRARRAATCSGCCSPPKTRTARGFPTSRSATRRSVSSRRASTPQARP